MLPIGLDVKTPTFEQPADMLAKKYTLQGMMQQQQLRDQQIQAAQLENQQRQQDLKDQQIFGQAYKNAGGDVDKALKDAMSGGLSPKASMAIQQHQMEIKTKLATLNKDQLENGAKMAGAIGGAAKSLQDMPDEQARALAWPGVRSGLIQQGIPQDQVPEQYGGIDWVNNHANLGRTSQQLHEAAIQQQNADANKKRAEAAAQNAQRQADEEKIKQQNEKLAATAAQMAAASKKRYAEYYDDLAPDMAARFDAPEDWDAVETPKRARMVGMTPAQQNTAANEQAERTQRSRQLDIEAGHLTVAQAREQRESGLAGSGSVDRHQATQQIRNLEKIENQANTARLQLGNALSNKRVYVDKNGMAKSFTSLGATDDEQKAMIDDMQARYDSATDLLKKTIPEKNEWLTRSGQKVGVDTPTALKALDAADAKLFPDRKASPVPPATPPPPAPAAPIAKPAAPAVQKVFPRARLAEFATKNNITAQQAEDLLTKQGWSVSK